MNDKIEKEVITLPPFKRFCMTIGELPTSYLESMTYYEMLVWFTNYLGKTVIPTIDNNAEAIIELQGLFVELQTYVNEYFDNLDVQEEINNKLDAMVEDGTMEELIAAYLTQNIDIIFPKRWAEDYSTMGDISLIKYKDKNVVIDTGLIDQWSNVRAMLLDHQVSHIDVMIITHWHNDHYTNLENLFNNNYIDSETKFFMPGDVTLWADIVAVQNEYKAWFETNGLTYYTPSENETYDIDLLQLKFNNTSDLDDYYSLSSAHDYNQCSMVVTVNFKNNRLLFMADCGTLAYTRMSEEFNINQKVDLFKIGHHGIGQATNYNFIKNICPDFAVNIASPTDFSKNMLTLAEEVEIMRNNGTQIYPTFMQKDYLVFNADGSKVKVVNGIPLATSHNGTTRDIYVDITVDNDRYQDGSEDYPYHELLQAIGTIDYNNDLVVNIHLADGDYCKSVATASSQKVKTIITGTKRTMVNILGNSSDRTAVSIQCCSFINANVTLKDLTVDSSNSSFDPISCENAIVTLNNVLVGSESRTPYQLILCNNSRLFVLNSKLYKCARGITMTNGSYATLRGVTFDGVTTNFIDASNSDYSTQGITISNSTPTFLGYRRKINSPIQIYNGASEGDTTAIPINSFDWIDVTYRTDDNVYGSTGRLYSPASKATEVKVPHLSGDNTTLYNKQAKIAFTNTAFEVSKRVNETITISNGNVTYSTPDHNIYVTKIVGGFNDFQSF